MFRITRFHHHRHRLPIHQKLLRIGDHRLHQHGIGRAIGGDVNEVKTARAVQHGAIWQAHAYLDAIRRAGTAFTAEIQQLPLRDREADADWVIAHNRDQRAAAWADDITGAERRTPRATIKGRADFGIVVVDLRLLQLRFCGCDLGLGFRFGSDAVIQGCLRDGVGFHQFAPARDLGGGIGQICARAIHLRAAERDLSREGRLFKGEQQLPGFHRIAFIEMPRLEKARDAGDDVNLVDGFDAPDEISTAADGLALHTGDKHRGWWRSGLLAGGGGFFLAAGQDQDRHGQGQNHR